MHFFFWQFSPPKIKTFEEIETKATTGQWMPISNPCVCRIPMSPAAHLSTRSFHMQVAALLPHRPDSFVLHPYHSHARLQKVRSPAAADKAAHKLPSNAPGKQMLSIPLFEPFSHTQTSKVNIVGGASVLCMHCTSTAGDATWAH